MKYSCGAALFIVLAVTVPCGSAPAQKNSNEIQAKTQDLKDLQKALKEKRVEKERCMLEEKCIRKELSRLERELSGLQKKGETTRREIRKAKVKLAQAEKDLKLAGWEKKQWSVALKSEAKHWYRRYYSHERLFSTPVDLTFRLQAMRQSKEYFIDAEQKERSSQAALVKWQAAQNRFMELKSQLEKTVREQAGLRNQKQDLLKSTIGRRVVAEEDIIKLTETAKALQQLIIKLEREKKKSDEEAAERKRFEGKKKGLPWPLKGEVVGRFGKSRHSELDTYVISNGIRIQAQSAAPVTAVARGEVIFSGEFRSYGLMVIIDHGGGFYSIYGQLGEAGVEEDQKINAGDVIGKLPAERQPALYFEVRSDGQPEDPLTWLQ